jgi:hypothetical protein
MLVEYPAKYRDQNGEVSTTIRNDGRTLTTVLRGVEFAGSAPDSMAPAPGQDAARVALFPLHRGSLCSCEIEFLIPVPVVVAGKTLPGVLRAHLQLGNPVPRGYLDPETLRLELTGGKRWFVSAGASCRFEDELLDIQNQLPEGVYVKTCINCAFSDYSPYGSGTFGDMACFRDHGEEYLAVTSKVDLLGIWDSLSGYVQETYLCPEFSRRLPGTGYRG